MATLTADEQIEEAWNAFDAWIAFQSYYVQELSLLDQIDLYAKAHA